MLKKKVYIIDEVHMLSSSAFNALLKTLEEPPEHIIFILATTELQKLPATITSRCQRFDFKRISNDDIARRLELIALKEDISLTHEAALLIGRLSQGGMRDSISLLELCSGSGKTVDVKLVNEAAGVTGRDTVKNAVLAVASKSYSEIFSIISDFIRSSVDISVFWQELISYYRDMLVTKTVATPKDFLDLTEDEVASLVKTASCFTKEKLLYHIRLLEDSYVTMQRGNSLKRVTAEMTLIKMSDDRNSTSNDALLSRIASLEERLATGNFMPASGKPREVHKDDETELKVDADSKKPEANTVATDSVTDKSEPLRSWSEVISSIELKDPGLSSSLMLAECKSDGKDVFITVNDSFSKMLIEMNDNTSVIATAINTAGEMTGIMPENIKILINKKGTDSSDSLDEF